MCNIGTEAQFTIIFSNGICGIESYAESSTFYIPRGDAATQHSLLNIDEAVSYPSTLINSDFQCSYKEDGITKNLVPLSF